VSDVTTNSSSEMFVCDTKLSIAKVKECLGALLKAYMVAQDLDHMDFDSVFGSVQLATEEDRGTAEEWEGYRGEQDEQFKNDPVLRTALSIGQPRSRIPVVGKDIVIRSEGDNSIPYELFDFIENIFNAGRYHLG
jgi:hypothetical protein